MNSEDSKILLKVQTLFFVSPAPGSEFLTRLMLSSLRNVKNSF